MNLAPLDLQVQLVGVALLALVVVALVVRLDAWDLPARRAKRDRQAQRASRDSQARRVREANRGWSVDRVPLEVQAPRVRRELRVRRGRPASRVLQAPAEDEEDEGLLAHLPLNSSALMASTPMS